MYNMLKVLQLLIVVTLVNSETARRKRHHEERQGKLFSFNVEEEDITIDLDFTVPFIKIPVKKTMDSVYGLSMPTININPASLALAGAVVLGTTVVIPYLVKYYARYEENGRYARLLDNTRFSSEGMLNFAEQILTNSHSIRGCPLRLACWAAQKDLADPRAILTQVIDNKLLSTMVNSSAVEDAMLSGLHGRSCDSYGPCPLQEHHVPMLMNNLAILTNTGGAY